MVEAPDLLCERGVLFHSLRRPSTTTLPIVPFFLVAHTMKFKMTITDHRAMEKQPEGKTNAGPTRPLFSFGKSRHSISKVRALFEQDLFAQNH